MISYGFIDSLKHPLTSVSFVFVLSFIVVLREAQASWNLQQSYCLSLPGTEVTATSHRSSLFLYLMLFMLCNFSFPSFFLSISYQAVFPKPQRS